MLLSTCTGVQRPERVSDPHTAGGTGSCESPDMELEPEFKFFGRVASILNY